MKVVALLFALACAACTPWGIGSSITPSPTPTPQADFDARVHSIIESLGKIRVTFSHPVRHVPMMAIQFVNASGQWEWPIVDAEKCWIIDQPFELLPPGHSGRVIQMGFVGGVCGKTRGTFRIHFRGTVGSPCYVRIRYRAKYDVDARTPICTLSAARDWLVVTIHEPPTPAQQ